MDYEILGEKFDDFLKTYDKEKLEEWIRFDEERTLRERRRELKEKIVNKICAHGNMPIEFDAKDINELITWIVELEEKLKNKL